MWMSSSFCVVRAKAFTSLFARRGGFLNKHQSSATTCRAAMSTMIENSNPLLQQEGLPKFETIKPEHVTPAIDGLLETLQQNFASLESTLSGKGNPDYEEVLPEVERMQFALGYSWGVTGHLNAVKNSDELREAYESSQPKVVQAFTKFSQSKPLYDALSAIEKQWEGTNDESFVMKQKRRAVETSLRGMKLGGVGLEGKEKERFNEIKMRLASLSTTFSNNVLDDTKAFGMVVTDPSKMEGVLGRQSRYGQAIISNT